MNQTTAIRPNVLLLDDDLQCRRFMEVSLRKAGYCVLTADSDSDAMEKAFMLRPHAVLTETQGPRVDGLALLEKFKAQIDTKDIPFIFVTRHRERVSPIIEPDSSIDVIDKPALMSDILDTVSRRVVTPTVGTTIPLSETLDFASMATMPMQFELDTLTDILIPDEDWAEHRARTTLKSSKLSTIPDFIFSKRGFQTALATSGLIALAHLLS